MHNIEAKTILSAHNGMNLYRGCTHGCIYCDSRSKCYQMDHAFEDVAVKANAPDLLESALRHKKHACMVGMGAMCDPYMHCEENVGLTRKALEIIDEHGCGATLITKSDRVMRDIDLIERINNHTKFVLQMTLTTYDEDLCRLVEPNVCTTRRRFEVLKEFQARGIPTVVWLCPILPFINDTEDNLAGILDYCTSAGVRGIICFGFGVTMREGNREYFYQELDKKFPGVKEKYIRTFGESYSCESKNSRALWSTYYKKLRGTGIITDNNEIFKYLNDLPEQTEQLSLF